MAAVTVATKTFAPAEAAVPPLTIVKPGTDPAAGPADRFTAAVEVTAPFKASGDARLSGATVTFQPGARSNWHSHPLGQLLIVTEGEGFVQVEGEAARRIGAGDTVWTAPGVKHWHGATPTSAMRHVAVAEAKDGTSVAWAEPVTDAQYRAAK
ncbi:cupin domain-containing protein [Sphingomonas naphthae]|uniref:Cupin domain-containing protein n=2 Tax=Sphingomonas naphthae TaxID=1813468 RepID=A0ABY7TQ72_9SPHN|nr:cupin domain-containing protein [Sphingomonas naphthae]WCT75379.1 cupin domain-containing protein [Sphingomonas naphthae]